MSGGRWGGLPPADIWFHGASAGDVRALAPLTRGAAARWPALRLLLTTQTRTGAAMAERPDLRLPASLSHGQAPLDLPIVAAAGVSHVAPKLLVLEYLELWPRQIAACHRRGAPVMVVDGRVSRRSLRWTWLLRGTARRIACFCARTAGDAERAVALGVHEARVFVTGNGKYDGLPELASPGPALRRALRPLGAAPQLVVGSLHTDELDEAAAALAASELAVVIAPRYLTDVPRLLELGARRGVGVARRSELEGGRGAEGARWIILDTIGELAAAYALAPVAIVGGTFGRRGGQNLVEPAAWGAQVIFGPSTENVAVEVEALSGRGGWPTSSWPEAVAAARERLKLGGPDPRDALAGLAGATEAHLEHMARLLGAPPRAATDPPPRVF